MEQLHNLLNERSAGFTNIDQLELFFQTRLEILHFFPKGLVSIDLETTGLSATNHEIIEVGAIKITPDGKIDIFHELWKPDQAISESSRVIHGLNKEMLAAAPIAQERLLALSDFIGESPILAHNAQYDLGFLTTYWTNLKYTLPNNLIYDSCVLSRFYFNKFLKNNHKNEPYAVPKNHKLETLKEFLGLDLIGHYALPDALAALRVFLYPLTLFQSDPLKVQEILIKSCLGSWNQLVSNKTGQKENINLILLQEIIKEQKNCEIIYHGGSIKGTWRPITPLHLVRGKQGLILVATCLIENQSKHFTLKKIGQIKNQNEIITTKNETEYESEYCDEAKLEEHL